MQPGELDSYRGEGGTVYPFYTANEQSFDDDDTPPPTPMWSNLPPPAPPETASRWKAVRKQISVAGRFWSAGQDRAEEAAVSALSELLQGLVAQGALSLERRLVEHRDTPPGAVWPHGWPPRYTQRVLQLPLTEASVLDLVADLSAGALPPLQYVAGLLHAAKASLAQLPNVLRHDVPTGCAVTVVGDLHGQFGDLLHVLRSRGFPSPTRPFVFNGDFVDRGPASVEVALTLFAFQLLLPNSVFLNRGNHEERSVHALYGFQRECNAKYAPDAGAAAYELFSEAFEHLPLATLLNGKVLVLHGGVDDEMTLEQLERLPRKEYAVNQANLLGTGRPGLVHPHMRARLAEIAAREKELRPINSALWNDPCAEPGVYPNRYRGTGLLFGADVAAGFLERSGLGLILRSHEQVPEGFHWPYGPGRHLATVFSASNYAGKTLNKGAYALLGATGSRLSDPALSPLPLDAAPGAAAPAASPEEEGATAEHAFGGLRFVSFDAEELPRLRVSQRRHQLVASAVLAQRDELLAAYQAADRGATGELPVDVWEEETRRVLRAPPMLLPPMRCFLLGRDWGGSPTVRYQAFLGRFRLAVPQLVPLLPYRDYLVLLLANLDAKRSGAVSPRQFAAACKAVHSQFGAAAALCAKPEEVLAAMGMAAGRGSREGSVAIRSVAAQLCVLVAGCPGAGSTSLSGFLSRLSTDEILLAAQPSPETPRGGSAGEAGDSSSAPMEEEDEGAEEGGDGRSISPPRRSSSATMVSSREDLMSDG